MSEKKNLEDKIMKAKDVALLNKFAFEKNFHPFSEKEKWYSVSHRDVLSLQVCVCVFVVVCQTFFFIFYFFLIFTFVGRKIFYTQTQKKSQMWNCRDIT